MERDFVFYQFSRSKVERGDFKNFMSLYALDKLPEGRPLRDMMNSFAFAIDGWDDDEREIHTIPEIRRFYTAFHDAWPYWLYFCNLDTDILRSMMLCCLPAITSLKVEGQVEVAVSCDPLAMLGFLKRDLMPMNQMCEQAGMFEDRIFGRTKAVFEYFGLPFDAEPPGGIDEAPHV